MSYFTERNGIRKPVEKTSEITPGSYYHLLEGCKKYYINIAWKYPKECPDGIGCYDLDKYTFYSAIQFEIPDLYFNNRGEIDCPKISKNIFESDSKVDDYNQYAILDFVEFMIDNIRDISYSKYHQFFKHYDLTFSNNGKSCKSFVKVINDIFEKCGLLYKVSDYYNIERIVENEIVASEIQQQIQDIKEVGLKELLNEAINIYKSPYYDVNKNAVEKMWDALERLKTYYVTLDKKQSVDKIIKDMSDGQEEFGDVFENEFITLTRIGNNFRIRHHETNKIDILDARHYDYFFNRCLSLIALAIQYLK